MVAMRVTLNDRGLYTEPLGRRTRSLRATRKTIGRIAWRPSFE